MSRRPGSRAAIDTDTVGFWSSLAFGVLLIALNISFAIMAVQVAGTAWEGMEAYSRTYRTIAFVPQAIGLATLPPLILMLASIHSYARESRKIWSLAGLVFGAGFAVLVGSLYFIQVGVVLPALRQGSWQGLDQNTFANPRSIAWGLNHFAWSLLGVSLLLMTPVFEGQGLKRWIRWLFVLNGLANASLLFAFAWELEALTLGVAFVSWIVALPITALLVARMFRSDLESYRRKAA